MRQPKTQALAPLISLKRLSQKSYSLASLVKLASKRQSLDSLLDDSLPAQFKGQFKVNSFNEGTLILTCPSAKLMTKFRFIQDKLIDNINPHLSSNTIKNIQIKIRPNISSASTRPKHTKAQHSISKKNAQILLEEAEHTEDENLRKTLEKLANNASQY